MLQEKTYTARVGPKDMKAKESPIPRNSIEKRRFALRVPGFYIRLVGDEHSHTLQGASQCRTVERGSKTALPPCLLVYFRTMF